MRGFDYLLGMMRSKTPGADGVEDLFTSGSKTPQVTGILRLSFFFFFPTKEKCCK
jgi:hypothetical protein